MDRGCGMLVILLAVALSIGCGRETTEQATQGPTSIHVEPQPLPLVGMVSEPQAEISSMFWVGDRLVMVPQHPERFVAGRDTLMLFVLDRADIEASIDQRRQEPLAPRPGLLVAPRLLDSVPGWDGIEAAAALDDTVFFAIEASVDGVMAGYLVRGIVDPESEPLVLTLDRDRIAPIPVSTQLANMTQEALVLAPGRVAVIFEANGVRVNPGAHVAVYDHSLDYRGTVPMDNLEFRITDACRSLRDSVFWVINYFFPGEGHLLKPEPHRTTPVERLIQLRFNGQRIVRTACPSLDLRGDSVLAPRNWEAIVPLSDRGFLIMTDTYPATLLAFVPLPDHLETSP